MLFVLLCLDIEAVQKIINQALPGLAQEQLDTVVSCLQDCGVETVADLELLEEQLDLPATPCILYRGKPTCIN